MYICVHELVNCACILYYIELERNKNKWLNEMECEEKARQPNLSNFLDL